MPLIIVSLDRVYVSQDLQEIKVNHASRMFHFLKFPILSSDSLHPNVSSKIMNHGVQKESVYYIIFFSWNQQKGKSNLVYVQLKRDIYIFVVDYIEQFLSFFLRWGLCHPRFFLLRILNCQSLIRPQTLLKTVSDFQRYYSTREICLCFSRIGATAFDLIIL